jgi:hypothetical protein
MVNWRCAAGSNSHDDLAGRTVLSEPSKSIRQLLFVRLTEDSSPYLETDPFNVSSSK